MVIILPPAPKLRMSARTIMALQQQDDELLMSIMSPNAEEVPEPAGPHCGLAVWSHEQHVSDRTKPRSATAGGDGNDTDEDMGGLESCSSDDDDEDDCDWEPPAEISVLI